MAITIATIHNIPGLVKLINSAYRGEESLKGWTSEAHFLEGDLRTDEDSLQELIQKQGTVFLLYHGEEGLLEGCVLLQERECGLYLGMLSVSPVLQARGTGRKLMEAAEDHARQVKSPSIFMRVISIRKELIEWYERRGYHLTGETEPMPTDTRFGAPTQPLEFVIMEKAVHP